MRRLHGLPSQTDSEVAAHSWPGDGREWGVYCGGRERRATAGAVGMARYQRVRIAQPICHGLLVVAVGELSVVVTVV
jgi:hypothetical protein